MQLLPQKLPETVGEMNKRQSTRVAELCFMIPARRSVVYRVGTSTGWGVPMYGVDGNRTGSGSFKAILQCRSTTPS